MWDAWFWIKYIYIWCSSARFLRIIYKFCWNSSIFIYFFLPVMYLAFCLFSISAFSEGWSSHIWCLSVRYIQILFRYKNKIYQDKSLNCRNVVVKSIISLCKMSIHFVHSIIISLASTVFKSSISTGSNIHITIRTFI